MRKLMKSAVVVVMSIFAHAAWAVPFTATIADQTTIGTSFYVDSVTSPGASAAGAAQLTFELIGYGGVDGYGPRISNSDVYDSFGFRVNDPTIDGVSFVAILNMGGSYPGAPILYDNNPGVNPLNATLVYYQDNGFNQGGIARFAVDFTLLQGANDFAFNFGLNRPAGEGWGLRNIVVTADLLSAPVPTNAVPEPQTNALMLAGLAALGFIARRRACSTGHASR